MTEPKKEKLIRYSELKSKYAKKGQDQILGFFDMALSKIARHSDNEKKTTREKKFRTLYAQLYQQAKDVTEKLKDVITVQDRPFSKKVLENTLDLLEINPFSKKRTAHQMPDKVKLKNYNESLSKLIEQLQPK